MNRLEEIKERWQPWLDAMEGPHFDDIKYLITRIEQLEEKLIEAEAKGYNKGLVAIGKWIRNNTCPYNDVYALLPKEDFEEMIRPARKVPPRFLKGAYHAEQGS